MSDQKIKEKINNAVARNVPDVLDNILEQCDTKKGDVRMKEKKKMKSFYKIATAMAAMLVLVVGIVGASQIVGLDDVETVIAFDVNPSIELEVNAHGKVVKVNAINEDAQIVIGDMNFRHVDYDIAVNAILGSMLKNGYLSTDQNSILVSVHSRDEKKAEALKETITTDITSILEGSNIEASVIVQDYEKNHEVDKIAQENKISHAKAKLIARIIKAGLTDADGYEYTYERLAELTVTELKVLLDCKQVELENVESSGTASETKYLGKPKALELVYADAGVEVSQVVDAEVDMDYEDGIMIYEIEFYVNGYEYGYKLNAITGEILASEKTEEVVDSENEQIPGQIPTPEVPTPEVPTPEVPTPEVPTPEVPTPEVPTPEPPTPGEEKDDPAKIGRGNAKKIALEHANVKRPQIKELKCDFAEVDGKYIYKVKFEYEGIEYTYNIDVYTGEILSVEQVEKLDKEDKLPGNKPEPPTPEEDTTEHLDKEAAIAIAFADAGVAESDVKNLDCKVEQHKEVLRYKITFHADEVRYDYKINAVTGEILEVIKDENAHKPGEQSGNQHPGDFKEFN